MPFFLFVISLTMISFWQSLRTRDKKSPNLTVYKLNIDDVSLMSKRGRNNTSAEDDEIIVVSSSQSHTPLYTALKRNVSNSWNIIQLNHISSCHNEYFLRCVIFDNEDTSIPESDINWIRRKFSDKCFIVIHQPSAMNGRVILHIILSYSFLFYMTCDILWSYLTYTFEYYLLLFC
jgi:hypothetical protein